jgi:hypothetical protein
MNVFFSIISNSRAFQEKNISMENFFPASPYDPVRRYRDARTTEKHISDILRP